MMKNKITLLFSLCGLLFVFSPLFGPTEAYIFPQYLQMPDAIFASRIIELICFVVSCALFPFYDKLPQKTRWAIGGICTLLIAASMVFTSLPAFGMAPGFIVFGGVLRGLGFGILVIIWEFNFAKLRGNDIGVAISGALLVYGLACTVITLVCRISPAIAAFLLVLCPIASSTGSFIVSTKMQKPESSVERHEPLTKSGKRTFMVSNFAYGILFGMLLNCIHMMEFRLASVEFTVMAAILVIVFLLYGRAADYARGLRIYAVALAFALPLCTLANDYIPDSTYYIVSAVWAIQLFFADIIFVDVEFMVPGITRGAGGVALSFLGLGILVASLLPFGQPHHLDLTSVVAMTFACIIFITAVFLPSERRSGSRLGFSAFTLPESEESFVARRCDEIAQEFGLTKRELEVMQLLARGLQTDQISDQLFISPLTTKTHLHKVYSKTGVHSRDEFTRLLNEGDRKKEPDQEAEQE